MLVAGSFHVPDFEVAVLLLLIDLEEEVLLSDDFFVGLLRKLLSVDLVFELNQADLLIDDFVDILADVIELVGAASLAELVVETRLSGGRFQLVKVSGLRGL